MTASEPTMVPGSEVKPRPAQPPWLAALMPALRVVPCRVYSSWKVVPVVEERSTHWSNVWAVPPTVSAQELAAGEGLGSAAGEGEGLAATTGLGTGAGVTTCAGVVTGSGEGEGEGEGLAAFQARESGP